MASGKPLSDKEKAFIRANRTEKFPSVLARHLGLHYSADNGGSRCTETVKIYLKSLDAPAPVAEEAKPEKATPPARVRAPRVRAKVN
ncbi:MAG: hypothetical protein WC277_06975 [Bacilli bacterium]